MIKVSQSCRSDPLPAARQGSIYHYRQARKAWEFDQIHRLNYKTFVEEIPQHPPNGSKYLIDRFHAENTYFICLKNEEVVGMLALRGKRPFSLDAKLDDLDRGLPPHKAACEIRLLSIKKKHRSRNLLRGLLRTAMEYGLEEGYDLAVISGTVRQARLYAHLGFQPFGHLVGSGEALYQPMYGWATRLARSLTASRFRKNHIYLMPGPVKPSPGVERALVALPVSHRSSTFVKDLKQVKETIGALVNSRFTYVLSGSGTLANEVVAGQLSAVQGPGLILSNGEFGERLIDHAQRFRLEHQALRYPWGQRFDYEEIDACLSREPRVSWLWFAHCETSTGMLNDLKRLSRLDVKVCVDAISSIGNVPVDLSRVYLASGASNKGLRSMPGLALVFSRYPAVPASLPRYLDLSLYAADYGVPYTLSSNLVYALKEALKTVQPGRNARHLAQLQQALKGRGFKLICEDDSMVVTLALSSGFCSREVGKRLEHEGILISYKSEYLVKRNWIQLCLMGDVTSAEIWSVLDGLERVVHP